MASVKMTRELLTQRTDLADCVGEPNDSPAKYLQFYTQPVTASENIACVRRIIKIAF